MRLIACHNLRRSQAVIASVPTGLVLLLSAMAASPTLHELFHSDASNSQHQCAVTMFAHGQVDSASCDVPVVGSMPLIQAVSVVEISVYSPSIENLPAGRAPPVSSSNS